jgi:hypothetical protein
MLKLANTFNSIAFSAVLTKTRLSNLNLNQLTTISFAYRGRGKKIMKCTHIKPDGTKCSANAMTESEFCFSHNPDSQEDKELAVLKGGLAPKKKEEQALEPLPVNTPNEVLALIQDTINRVRSSPMTHQKANCIGYLASIALKTMEVGELGEKIELINSLILERKIKIKK